MELAPNLAPMAVFSPFFFAMTASTTSGLAAMAWRSIAVFVDMPDSLMASVLVVSFSPVGEFDAHLLLFGISRRISPFYSDFARFMSVLCMRGVGVLVGCTNSVFFKKEFG